MEQENIRKETFLATLLLLAGTLILWKGYSYEPDSRQFPVFLAGFSCLSRYSMQSPSLKNSKQKSYLFPLSFTDRVFLSP